MSSISLALDCPKSEEEIVMELGLTGRTAVISGGSKGIGAAIAKGLAAEGVNIVLLARGKGQGKTKAEFLDD